MDQKLVALLILQHDGRKLTGVAPRHQPCGHLVYAWFVRCALQRFVVVEVVLCEDEPSFFDVFDEATLLEQVARVNRVDRHIMYV